MSTSSKSFKSIPGLKNLLIQNRGPVTASVSAVLEGAPVKIRVRQHGARPLVPGAVGSDPGDGNRPFSFDFIDLRNRTIGCRTYSVEWRSPSGQSATLTRGNFIVTFNFDNKTKEGLITACV